MSKPYDATAKDLLEADPAGLAALVGVVRPRDRIRLVDSDVSTVTAIADKVLRIEDEEPWLLHVEFQSSRDVSLTRRMLLYNAILQERHRVAVASVLVLLVPEANSPVYTGRYEVSAPFGPSWGFEYSILRVWKWSTEAILKGPVDLLALAPIADVEESNLAGVLERIEKRLDEEAEPATAGRVYTAIGVLLQLRYGAMTAEELVRKIPDIREFAAFRTFIEEGREQGRIDALQNAILHLGRKRFGLPDSMTETTVRALKDPIRLETIHERLLDVDSWNALLAPTS